MNNVLASEVVAAGLHIDKGKKGFAIARCGETKACIICLGIVPAPEYEKVKMALEKFLGSATFEAPSMLSMYADFNWKEFLTNQVLTTYAYLESGSKETTVDLCADGTIKASVSKKGILKNQNPQYKGKLSGKWTAAGIGEKGTLHLEFTNNLPVLDVELFIKEEKIYANGERFFAGMSEKCKEPC